MAEKAGYPHFMLKEIYEQPWAVRETVLGRVVGRARRGLPRRDAARRRRRSPTIERVVILACGTSWHAGLVGKFLIEAARAACRSTSTTARSSAIASRSSTQRTLAIAITQSGETADTLGALREAQAARRAQPRDLQRRRQHGHARGGRHASTRTRARRSASRRRRRSRRSSSRCTCSRSTSARRAARSTRSRAATLIRGVDQLPVEHRAGAQDRQRRSRRSRARFTHQRDFLYLGRGVNYPIALEGALKLKEISYIHAEGYPAGEMKHGPIALIDEDLPVVAIAADDGLFEKMLGNIQEAKARGGRVIVVTNASKARDVRRDPRSRRATPSSPSPTRTRCCCRC